MKIHSEQLGFIMAGTDFLHRQNVGGVMARNRFVKSVSFVFALSVLGYKQYSQAEIINKCLWSYSSTSGKVNILNKIAIERLKNKKQIAIKTSRGDMQVFDIIPGPLVQEPVFINGGLWYKIQYFEGFEGVLTSQSLLKETLLDESKNQLEMINGYLAKGHPIIVPARSTQHESIYASLKKGITPSFANGKQLSLADHAKDLKGIISYLRSKKMISATSKIQLASLSYGVNVLREFKGLNEDLVLHSTIIAPLAYAGDNYVDATQKQDQIIKMAQMGYTPWLLNPMTYGFGKMGQEFVKSYILSLTAQNYAKKLVDNAFANDPDLQAKEKEFPGFKKLVQQGLANDMDAARRDIFELGDPKYFHLYKNTTLIFAGDEEPSRLKAQMDAYLKMKKALKEEAPNLIIMDDAQHATTATAPVQTANMYSTMMLHDVSKSEGAVFYMHRLDKEAKPNLLSPELLEVIINEINNEAIGPASVSQLEVLFYPQIFASRLTETANAVKDIYETLQLPQKKEKPSDFKETPDRPYLKFQYMDLNSEQKGLLQKDLDSLAGKLKEYNEVQKKAEETLKKLQSKLSQAEKK